MTEETFLEGVPHFSILFKTTYNQPKFFLFSPLLGINPHPTVKKRILQLFIN